MAATTTTSRDPATDRHQQTRTDPAESIPLSERWDTGANLPLQIQEPQRAILREADRPLIDAFCAHAVQVADLSDGFAGRGPRVEAQAILADLRWLHTLSYPDREPPKETGPFRKPAEPSVLSQLSWGECHARLQFHLRSMAEILDRVELQALDEQQTQRLTSTYNRIQAFRTPLPVILGAMDQLLEGQHFQQTAAPGFSLKSLWTFVPLISSPLIRYTSQERSDPQARASRLFGELESLISEQATADVRVQPEYITPLASEVINELRWLVREFKNDRRIPEEFRYQLTQLKDILDHVAPPWYKRLMHSIRRVV